MLFVLGWIAIIALFGIGAYSVSEIQHALHVIEVWLVILTIALIIAFAVIYEQAQRNRSLSYPRMTLLFGYTIVIGVGFSSAYYVAQMDDVYMHAEVWGFLLAASTVTLVAVMYRDSDDDDSYRNVKKNAIAGGPQGDRNRAVYRPVTMSRIVALRRVQAQMSKT
jgi:heme A synthase